MRTIRIHSSHANGDAAAFVASAGGYVLKSNVTDEFGSLPARFDTYEFIKHYNKLDQDIDILDIGYTDHDSVYTPPDHDFRAYILTEFNKPQDGDSSV